MDQSKKILIVVNKLAYFISHRLPIAVAAQKAGYTVHVAYGDSVKKGECDSVLRDFELHFVPMERGGTNPLADLCSGFLLWCLFRRLQPDLVHLVTIKPILYGGIAARLARVPAIVSAMAGLGFVFVERAGLKTAGLRSVVKPLFRWALGHPHQRLIFQNPDDRDRVLDITRVCSEQTQLIRGSGIDLAAGPFLPEPDGQPIVVMASRLLRDKGVLEFVTAARWLRERDVSARFWLIGDIDSANPNSVTPQDLAAWQGEGVVECLGHRLDVPSMYAQAHIVTLPSYYGEGLPKSLIEAAACGRAVVTTDMPGCRDAIEPDVSGLLVPARDVVALADALERLIRDTALRQAMGKAGRALAESEFGIEKVVAAHLQIYRELLEPCAS
jgi:glycosyltransferase involved in cell wall biosynthesis